MPTVQKSSRSRSSAKTTRRKNNARKSSPKSRSKSASRARTASRSSRTRSSGQSSSRNRRTRSRQSPQRTGRGTSRSGHITIDHDEIREWVEARGGHPATVAGTERGSEEAGLLRIDFPGYSGEQSLTEIEWEDFFEKFEEAKLAFLYDPDEESRFNKLVARGRKRF